MNLHSSFDTHAWQQAVIDELGVERNFDVDSERERRIAFLGDYLASQGLHTYVLGISGGVDSSTAGRLAQLAVERLRATGYEAHFVAVRLPYGSQRDEEDAAAALAFIRPDETLTVNIKEPADAMLSSLKRGNVQYVDDFHEDFVLGNIKARQRMIAQYAIAGARVGVVIGTDHAAESLMGFFTKFGDGGADILPLAGLTKRRVRALAHALGASERLVDKVPTADLESLTPQKPDEDSYGISYQDIDDFLEGKPVSDEVLTTIRRFYMATRHKRALPVAPTRSSAPV
ncbi:ammonia-dependent NAD(+) synthetase [Paraburkholderia sp. JPY303]|uniref:NH(3)-dependent NAD(+) synthetase n=1 Tax=Paraburkholderia atlantica TaxID=2654982 RepID=D5WM77_PARAM|nr:ammonia-dependent NAD(+) synthetase [Paraburkholderia atlantica]ADG20323.1 NAD+ synthetase [Paraburkholderia atlantica]MBB5426892.1 NAD+ synthase [Paraburkholderia atlantica]MBB5509389.1 NAD+ synthase [Paraburkholderia atlantica]NUY34395.1 ammonia-dependent NAD(+) synthetase [Paraburkholderia atlantica]